MPSFRVLPCAHNFGTSAIATAWSGADDPQLSERVSSKRCSESRQTWAATKGFEHDAICETEESEAAGADSTKGRREAQRGMRGWGKGLEWVFLRLPLLTWSLGYSSSFISSTCDKISSIERHKLSPSPRIAPVEDGEKG